MTAAHANGRAPFDLDAAAAAAEATGEPFVFTWKGEQHTLPPQSQWPMKVVRLLAGGDINAAMAELMGDEDYEAMCESGMTLGDLKRLFEAIGEDAGMGGLPNSSVPAPAGSTRT